MVFIRINFRKSALLKNFLRVNSTFALRNIFLVKEYGFENNLSKNQYFFYLTNDKITDGLEKA